MLQALQIQAGPDSKSNDLIQDFDLAAKFRMDVVLLDRADKHSSSCTMIGMANS